MKETNNHTMYRKALSIRNKYIRSDITQMVYELIVYKIREMNDITYLFKDKGNPW